MKDEKIIKQLAQESNITETDAQEVIKYIVKDLETFFNNPDPKFNSVLLGLNLKLVPYRANLKRVLKKALVNKKENLINYINQKLNQKLNKDENS